MHKMNSEILKAKRKVDELRWSSLEAERLIVILKDNEGFGNIYASRFTKKYRKILIAALQAISTDSKKEMELL